MGLFVDNFNEITNQSLSRFNVCTELGKKCSRSPYAGDIKINAIDAYSEFLSLRGYFDFEMSQEKSNIMAS